MKPCAQEVIVQHNILYSVYFGGCQFTGNAAALLDFSLSLAASVMDCCCVGVSCLLDTSSADLLNFGLEHFEPGLTGLPEISELTSN